VDGLGYTGHDMDKDTGLTYMQQRYYDPVVGRFLSVDPVGADANTGGNFNRYWYANNNPYVFTDPDGRLACLNGNDECQRQQRADERRGIPSLQAGSSGSKEKSESSGCTECDEVRATRAGIMRDGGERLKEAGIFAAKESAMMFGFARIGKLLGGLLRIGSKIPSKVDDVLVHVRKTGKAPDGYVGGRVFGNREGILPPSGRYREYDVDPAPGSGSSRNAERIVIDENSGQAWYTADHYKTFVEI